MNSSPYANFEEIYTLKDIAKAKELQISMAKKVRIIPLAKFPDYVAGVDASFQNGKISASACLYRFPQMVHIEDSVFRGAASFPYIPGLFASREGPALIAAIKRLKIHPDLILIDGQGIAHPRGAGIASQVGLVLGTPAIGCAKTRLIGDYDEPGLEKGAWSYLLYPDAREKIGAVVRTRSGVRPVFVSPGHLVDIESSVGIVLDCASRFRIPEPLRAADMLSKLMINNQRGYEKE